MTLELVRGDAYTGDRALRVNVADAAGAPLDLSGFDLVFMVKRLRTDADLEALISKAIGSGITLGDQMTDPGLALIDVDASDTEDGPTGRFFGELQAVDPLGPVTLWSGRVTVTPDLIRES